MTNQYFWELIERSCGPGGDSNYAERLTNLLLVEPAKDVLDFYNHFLAARYALVKREVVVAGTLLNGGYCGDDGFEDFCNWLIAQGHKVYEQALTNVDSLADVSLSGVDGEPAAMFEEYGYVAPKVYETITGNDIFTASNGDSGLEQSSVDISVYQLQSDELIAQKFPRLWKKFGRKKQEYDASAQRLLDVSKWGQAAEANIPGLGQVRVGSVLRRNDSTNKKGTIQELILEYGDPIAKVKFEGQAYLESVLLSEDYFLIDKF